MQGDTNLEVKPKSVRPSVSWRWSFASNYWTKHMHSPIVGRTWSFTTLLLWSTLWTGIEIHEIHFYGMSTHQGLFYDEALRILFIVHSYLHFCVVVFCCSFCCCRCCLYVLFLLFCFCLRFFVCFFVLLVFCLFLFLVWFFILFWFFLCVRGKVHTVRSIVHIIFFSH